MSAVPPSYADLGKSARDLLTKGFNYGFYKLEAKTKTSVGVDFNTNCSSNHDSGKFIGNIETKFKWTDYGLTLTEKWNTDNTLGTEITIDEQLMNGLKLSFDTMITPQTGKKSGKIKTQYKRNYVHTNLDLDFDFAGPTVHGAAVLGYNGWLAGFQMLFDTSKSKLSQSNFAVGYTKEDFTLHTAINDGSEFTGSIFQKINDRLEAGLLLNWMAGANGTRFCVGAKYCADKDTTFRGKVSNVGQFGLSFQQKVRDGISLTFSTLLETKTFNQGGHKFGVGLEFEP